MTSIRVLVQGATGRMGREVLAAVCRESDLTLVGGVCLQPRGDRLTLPDGSGDIPLTTSLEQALESTDPRVVVDLTNSETLLNSVPVIASRGIHLVTGTSGLTESDLKTLEQTANQQGTGIIVCPNFALGAVVLQHLAKEASRFFDYVDIVEKHHEAKIDSPSGTAVAIARAITADKTFRRNVSEKENLPGTRGGDYKGVTIHAVRLPGTSAHHEIVFGAPGQTLTIRHDTLSRDCYMPGVVKAVREVVNRQGLVVGLDKLLGL